MLIYKKTKVFDTKTGEEKGWTLEDPEVRCDFSGQLLDSKDSDVWEYGSLKLDYGSADPCWSCHEPESTLRAEFGIEEMQMFMYDPFKISWNQLDACKASFVEWDGNDYGIFLREIRANTAIRLLREGTIDRYQILGYEGPEMRHFI